MKNLFIALFAICSSSAFAQVIIGDDAGTATDKTSVLLEFAKNSDTQQNNKGLILPYVQNLPTGTNVSEGTILLHAEDNGTKSRMKFYNGTAWVDLSGKDANITSLLNIQNGKSENADAKVLVGNNQTTAKGAFVLESNTQAMILPIVEDVNNIPSPSPGMIVYVKKAGAKRLAVFNGTFWSFWQP